MPQLVLTAVGPDRPGLVDEFTGCLLEAGANLADSRMINLRGQFALIVLVEASADAMGLIRTRVVEVGKRIGLAVTIGTETTSQAQSQPGLPLRLRAQAMDQPGIVHQITHLLYSHGINIEELDTRLQPGSYTGTPLFSVDLRMSVPPDVQVKALRGELERLCDSLNCDVDIEPA